MILNFYSLKDELVGFNSPMLLENDDLAIRNIRGAVIHTQELKDNAKDYSIYRLGSFDTETGHIIPLEIPYKVVDVVSLVPQSDISEVK